MMLEFNSKEFLDVCREEIASKGYCYLRERLSRCGGMDLEYLLETEEELNKLPVRPQALWYVMVANESPFVEGDFMVKAGVELMDGDKRIVKAGWINKASPKAIALVFTNGEPILGSY